MDREQRRQKSLDYYYAHRDEMIAASRAYKEAHKEELREKRKAAYQANREEAIEYQKAWKKAHRKSVNATQRRYHQKHHDEVTVKRRVYAAAHRQELNQRQREYNRNNREKIRAAYIRRTYGLSVEEYNAIYEQQGGCCGICKQTFGQVERLHVDHDHGDGRVRGLLCSNCNTAIGLLKDDINALKAAIEYLSR